MKKVLISGLIMVLAVAVNAETVTNNLDVQGGFIYNHGAINPDDYGLTFTNAGIRDVTISAGQLSGVDPESGEVITNAANLLPIRAQSLESSADIHAASNIVAGGTFVGDGSGLTNLSVEVFSGTIQASQIEGGVLTAGVMPTSGVWNASGLTLSNPALAGRIQVSGDALSVSTNLTVEGTISGDASGLTGVPAGGNDGELQFNEGGVLSGNTNYFIHPQTGRLAFNAPEGNVFRAYTGSVADTNLIYSVRNENGIAVVRLIQNTNENIRFSGDGEAFIAGDLQVGGQIVGDGSGLTNLITPELDGRYLQQSGGVITGSLQVVGPIIASDQGYYIGENRVLYGTVSNETDQVYVGIGAGTYNTNTEVVAVGSFAGQYASGESGVYVGQDAGQYSTGERVVLLGEDAGQCNTGIYTVAIGEKAGRYNTGDYTVMLMRDAGYFNSGSNSVLIGRAAGRSNTGNDAHLIGEVAGYNNAGDHVVIIGRWAGYDNSGSDALIIGQNAGQNNAGDDAILIGRMAGQENTGTNTVLIGRYAGRNNTGSRVIALGQLAGLNNTNDNRLFIDMNNSSTNTLIYGEFDNNLIRINGDLDVTGTLSGDGSGLTNLNVITTETDPLWTAEKENYLTSGDAEQTYLPKAGGTVEGDLAVQGALVAWYIPPQGDLLMGGYTNGLPQ